MKTSPTSNVDSSFIPVTTRQTMNISSLVESQHALSQRDVGMKMLLCLLSPIPMSSIQRYFTRTHLCNDCDVYVDSTVGRVEPSSVWYYFFILVSGVGTSVFIPPSKIGTLDR